MVPAKAASRVSIKFDHDLAQDGPRRRRASGNGGARAGERQPPLAESRGGTAAVHRFLQEMDSTLGGGAEQAQALPDAGRCRARSIASYPRAPRAAAVRHGGTMSSGEAMQRAEPAPTVVPRPPAWQRRQRSGLERGAVRGPNLTTGSVANRLRRQINSAPAANWSGSGSVASAKGKNTGVVVARQQRSALVSLVRRK